MRDPLAPIRNAVKIIKLADGELASIAEAREILDRQTQQLAPIVDDLLHVSHSVQGKVGLRKQRVALATVVTTAVGSSRSLIEARRHRLTVILPPETLYLYADPAWMGQALVNLLNNVAEFTEAGGQIDLPVEPDMARQQIVISVRDNGVGVPEDLLPRIFTMYTQGDRSLERCRAALGVGLTLVRNLVDLHEGTVEARSAGPGQGGEFIG